MKYWNKDKRIRQTHWHRVESSMIRQRMSYHDAKRYLQSVGSSGKFYLYYGSDTVWFEREEDAAWYILSRS